MLVASRRSSAQEKGDFPVSGFLFVYGTLRPGHAPSEIADIVRTLEPVGKGTIAGRLYDLGEFPAVVLDGPETENVAGEVLLLPRDPDVLTRLDAYEEYWPEDPASSLFKRVMATVALNSGSLERCWVYVYNQALPDVAHSGLASSSHFGISKAP